MFDFSSSPWPVPDEITAALVSTWETLAAPGTSFTGGERVAIAAAARAAKQGIETDLTPPEGTAETVRMMAGSPARTTNEWVDEQVGVIGGARYTEVNGVVSQVVAVDTFTRLLGFAPEPLPVPVDGEPGGEVVEDLARGGRTWFPAGDFPSPPSLLAMTPAEVVAQNVLSDVLYMPEGEMVHADWLRNDLHRTQMEVVAASTSHVNECFF